jgi:hypothetical protein
MRTTRNKLTRVLAPTDGDALLRRPRSFALFVASGRRPVAQELDRME